MGFIRHDLRRVVAAFSSAVALAGALVVSTPSTALADGNYCGHLVLGEIEARYLQMGGTGGKLGCPLTGELSNPDGVGKRTQFAGGTIYWSPRSGAWPVWGAIGDRWCDEGCEGSWIGYPTSYERTVGREVQQSFQCAVIHWEDQGGGASRTWLTNTCV